MLTASEEGVVGRCPPGRGDRGAGAGAARGRLTLAAVPKVANRRGRSAAFPGAPAQVELLLASCDRRQWTPTTVQRSRACLSPPSQRRTPSGSFVNPTERHMHMELHPTLHPQLDAKELAANRLFDVAAVDFGLI